MEHHLRIKERVSVIVISKLIPSNALWRRICSQGPLQDQTDQFKARRRLCVQVHGSYWRVEGFAFKFCISLASRRFCVQVHGYYLPVEGFASKLMDLFDQSKILRSNYCISLASRRFCVQCHGSHWPDEGCVSTFMDLINQATGLHPRSWISFGQLKDISPTIASNSLFWRNTFTPLRGVWLCVGIRRGQASA